MIWCQHGVFYAENNPMLMLYLCLISCPTRSALCWIAALCSVIWQKQKPCVSAAEGTPELRWSRNATQLQPVAAHTLTRIETYQLRCRSRAETQRTRIRWNLRVKNKVLHLKCMTCSQRWTHLFIHSPSDFPWSCIIVTTTSDRNVRVWWVSSSNEWVITAKGSTICSTLL